MLAFRLLLVFTCVAAVACSRQAADQNVIAFWSSNNRDEISLTTNATKAWNSQRNGTSVHVQPIPEGQSSEEVILAAVVGKTTPDIYANMWQGNVEMYARSGVLVALDTLPGFMAFLKERCDSNVIREITSGDGHIYQVPWKANPIMTIYNADLLRASGIGTLPLTYGAYHGAAEKFKQHNAPGGTKRFGYTEVKPIWYQRLFNFYPLYLAASGGAPLITNRKAAFHNRYAIGVFRFLQTLYTEGYFSKESGAASSDPFVMQTIATKWTGPWEIPYLLRMPDRHFAFGYYPPPVPDDHTGPVYTYADPKNIVIFNRSTNARSAWAFIKTLIDKEGDLKLLQVTGQLPRRKDLETDPYFTAYFENNPMLLPFAQQMRYTKGIDNSDVIVEVLDIISQEYEACVVYGRKTPEKAIADAERAVNVLLQDGK